MKKALAALLLVAGCSSPSKPSDGAANDPAFEKLVVTQLAFDFALLKGGQRVLYTVRQQGSPTAEYYQWAVVAEEGQDVWIENKVPHPPTDMILKYRVDRSGKVHEYWAGPPGGTPVKRYPRPGAPADPPPQPRRDSSGAQAQSKEEADTITVAGKTYACTKVTTVLSYSDGRKSTMVNWMSKEVPFASQKLLGGLVKRQFGRLTMELVDSGDKGARPELAIPAQK